MSLENALLFSGGEIVQADPTVQTSQGERFAIRRDGGGVERHSFRLDKNRPLQAALVRLPDFCDPRLTASDQSVPVRRESDALHTAIAAGKNCRRTIA